MQFELVQTQEPEGGMRPLVVSPNALDTQLRQIQKKEDVQLQVRDRRLLSTETSEKFCDLKLVKQDVRLAVPIADLRNMMLLIFRDAERLSRQRMSHSAETMTKKSAILCENPAPFADDPDEVIDWAERNPKFRVIVSRNYGVRFVGYPEDIYEMLTQVLEDNINALMRCMRQCRNDN